MGPGRAWSFPVAPKILQTATRKHCFYCSVFVPLALRAWCSTAVSSSTRRLHRRALIPDAGSEVSVLFGCKE
jgi:hypothetical protein